MKAKKKSRSNRVASDDVLSGVLDSPYGYMSIELDLQRTVSFWNGHKVLSGKLVGVSLPHSVPEHWVKPDND